MTRRRAAAVTLAAAALLAAGGCSGAQPSPDGAAGSRSPEGATRSPTGPAGSSKPGPPEVGDTLAEIRLAGHPSSLALGFGSLWVTVSQDTGGLLVRIDPATEEIVAAIPVGSSPTGVVVAAGSIWVSSWDDGTLAQVDPASNTVLGTIPVGLEPDWLATDAGMLWVGSEAKTLTRVEAASGRRMQSVTVGDERLTFSLAAGAGSVWTSAAGRGLIRLDSVTGRILAEIPIPRCCDGDLLLTEDVVRVSDTTSGTIYEVDPATNRVARQFTAEVRPYGMAIAGGHLWVTHASGQVAWYSPETGRMLGSTHLPGSAGSMVVIDDSIWVQDWDASMVVRLATG